ncbi:hypothetical protein THRCLA_05900 [Thraustotheca clavata]|uniref:Secreted protein n=1 Tax=Thraustotheca clavata TaxID=74557 RepID=A0A1V9ZRR9_9STRA|nr:hypothetical protein THRCLA_05900 [Thraustotheca clavata]
MIVRLVVVLAAAANICDAPTCHLLAGNLCNRTTMACPICLVVVNGTDIRCVDALSTISNGTTSASCLLGTKCLPPASAPSPTSAIIPLRTTTPPVPALEADNSALTILPVNNSESGVGAAPIPVSSSAPIPTANATTAMESSMSTMKNYFGVTVWVICLIAGVFVARRMYRVSARKDTIPDLTTMPRNITDSKDDIAMLDSYRSSMHKAYSSTRSDPVLTRGRPLDTFRGMSLMSLTSTGTNINNGTLLERGSKPAVVNVPSHIFSEEEEDSVGTIRSNPTFNATFVSCVSNTDSVEAVFDSMRTRTSNMTLMETHHVAL